MPRPNPRGKRPKGTNGGAKGPGSGSWGGPARGEGKPRFTAETAAMATARRDDPEARATRDEMRAAMLNVLLQVAETGSDNARVIAADKVLDRIDGKAVQAVKLGGDGSNEPVQVNIRIVES